MAEGDEEAKDKKDFYPWPPYVVKKGELKVFPETSFVSSVWGKHLDPAIAFMNDSLKSNNIDLKFTRVDDKNGARVTCKIVDGHRMHGENGLHVTGRGRMDDAAIALPKAPTITEKSDGKAVTDDMLRHILVHEFIHAIGIAKHAASGTFVAKLGLDSSLAVPKLALAAETVALARLAWPPQT